MSADPFVVDRDRDALVAEGTRGLTDEFGTPDRLGIDRNLVGAGTQQRIDIRQRLYAAAHRERHEYLLRHPFDGFDHAPPRLLARYDVEHDQFVDTVIIVDLCRRHRVAGDALIIKKPRVFHQAPVAQQEFWNQSLFQHFALLGIPAEKVTDQFDPA